MAKLLLSLILALPAAAADKPFADPAPVSDFPEAEKKPVQVEAPKPVKASVPVAAAPVSKELTPCAKCLLPLADTYKKAQEEMTSWITEVDLQTKAVNEKVADLEAQIEKNEAQLTKLKLEDTNMSRLKSKEVQKENKALWADLTAARKERDALCAEFAKEATLRVDRYASEAKDRLKQAKSEMR